MGMLPKSARASGWVCLACLTSNSCPNLETEEAHAHKEGTGTQRKGQAHKGRNIANILQHPPTSSNILQHPPTSFHILTHPPTCGLLMMFECWISGASISKTQNTDLTSRHNQAWGRPLRSRLHQKVHFDPTRTFSEICGATRQRDWAGDPNGVRPPAQPSSKSLMI